MILISNTYVVFVELMGICDGLVETGGRRELLLALGGLGEEEFGDNEGLDEDVPPEREIANLQRMLEGMHVGLGEE